MTLDVDHNYDQRKVAKYIVVTYAFPGLTLNLLSLIQHPLSFSSSVREFIRQEKESHADLHLGMSDLRSSGDVLAFFLLLNPI